MRWLVTQAVVVTPPSAQIQIFDDDIDEEEDDREDTRGGGEDMRKAGEERRGIRIFGPWACNDEDERGRGKMGRARQRKVV